MLAFRYAPEDYIILTIDGPGARRAQMIFTCPDPESMALSHWSLYRLEPRQWISGLEAAFHVASRAGAKILHVSVPKAAQADPTIFRMAGFYSRPIVTTLFLYSADPEIAASCQRNRWALTNAHMGLYTYH